MILSGVARSGKSTFWKRLAIKGFQPSEISTSTGVAESHFLSASERMDSEPHAHLCTEMLFDLHLYSETDTSDTSDLNNEALCIYKHILESHKDLLPTSTQSESTLDQRHGEVPTSTQSESTRDRRHGEVLIPTPVKKQSNQGEAFIGSRVSDKQDGSSNPNLMTSSSSTNEKPQSPTDESDSTQTDVQVYQQKSAKMALSHDFSPVQSPNDLISQYICHCFDELNDLLKKGEKVPIIKIIKKICHLIDAGGQRAFLELLPTLTVGKALYLLFFSYEQFDKRLHETVQMKHSAMEVSTGTQYHQMDVIMQSLICVSTTSKTSSDNVAMLVGTHVDKVQAEDVRQANKIVKDHVEPFLKKNSLVFAEKNKLVLEVSIEENEICSNDPEHYKKIIMDLVEKRLACPESSKLPSAWYMFSLMLRKLQHAGYSVLQYHHCQLIAERLFIRPTQLQSLLARLHKFFGIVMYFPEVEQLKDIVICNPAVVYKGISEIIFDSFNETVNPMLSLKLKRWGLFSSQELMQYSRTTSENKESQLDVDKLLIILQHQGIIAPFQITKSHTPLTMETVDVKDPLHSQYIIPCMLDDVPPEFSKLQIQDDQACSIAPLRIYFSCGFSPMGGFCYLFSKLVTNNSDKGWELILPNKLTAQNSIYWRNKVTFTVDKKYFVTLHSTHEYYEISIVYSQSDEPFALGSEGHCICKRVWNAVNDILSNSPNSCLQDYVTASECVRHQNTEGYDGHIMKFNHNPDVNKAKVTAMCTKSAMQTEVTVDEAKQSVIVWFKV